MARCPYAAEVWDWPKRERHLVQCERRKFLGSAGWHLHRARLPEPWRTHTQVNIRWRSTNAPDYSLADEGSQCNCPQCGTTSAFEHDDDCLYRIIHLADLRRAGG